MPFGMDETCQRVLIVDDDEVDRLAIRRALAASGVAEHVDEELDGARVPARLAERAYDCVILDLDLPGDSGLRVLERIRAAGFATPVLVVSGDDEASAARTVAAGATDDLPKADLSPARLARRLRYAIRVGRAEARIRKATAELAAERQLFEAALRQLPAAVIVAEAEKREIVLANEMAGELLGKPITRHGDLGQVTAIDACRDDGAALAPEGWPIVRALAGETIVAETLECVRPDGTRRALRAGAAPVVDAEGRLVAAVMTLSDVTGERRAQLAVEQAARAREELLAIVSHDLRNPLNAINIAVEEIAGGEMDGETRARYLAAIRRSIARANRLITDLLDASIIEAGKLHVEPRSIPVRGLLERTAKDYEVLGKEAGCPISVDLDDSAVRVLADRERVLQALGNLVGNALRHGRGKGPVVLSARPEGRDVRLVVADSGPGVDPKILPRIFDRYYHAGSQRRAGAGLGLAIVKGIAEAHGGKVLAANREGGGAEFSFTLPAG
jgi:signal transduction histidine kinase